MAKANKSIFEALRASETVEYTDKKTGETHEFTIYQLTLGDVAEISGMKENEAEVALIARSMKMEMMEVRDIPLPLVKVLTDKIVEFNELEDIIEKKTE